MMALAVRMPLGIRLESNPRATIIKTPGVQRYCPLHHFQSYRDTCHQHRVARQLHLSTIGIRLDRFESLNVEAIMKDKEKQKLTDEDTRHDLRTTPRAPTTKRKAGRNFQILILTVGFLFLFASMKQVARLNEAQTKLSNDLASVRIQLASIKTDMDTIEANIVEREEQKKKEVQRAESARVFTKQIRMAHSGGEARCVSWADYDNDGDLDVLLCSEVNRLYQNNGGTFREVTAAAGLTGGTRCASWADYDVDGDLDLFDTLGRLLTNENGVFKNDSALLPKYPFSNTEGFGWLDANGDGLPDILISDGEAGIHLILNRGKGADRFENADARFGLGKDGLGVGNGDFLSIADYDGDGFPDFLYNLLSGVLAHNVRGERYELAPQAGVSYRSENPWKFGTAWGDFDNDGDLDLFVPQNGAAQLYLNNGDGKFINIISETGDLAAFGSNACSATWGDINLDGKLDLIVGYPNGPARLFLNSGDGVFVDQPTSGLQSFAPAIGSTALMLADFDNDGDLDLLATSESTYSGILINEAAKTKGKVSLKVKLPLETPGAVVRVYNSDKKLLAMQQLGLVQSFSSQGPNEAVFGVSAGSTYSFEIISTNGKKSTPTVVVGEGNAVFEIGTMREQLKRAQEPEVNKPEPARNK